MHGHAAAVAGPADQALADDAAQGGGQRQAHLALLVGREQVDAAVDGLGGVGGVEGGQDQVAGLGGGQGGLEGLGVADLADQDDVGVLAHGGPHGDGEVVGVDPDLALVHHAQLVGVEHLDGVLDRHDVDGVVGVDVVDHGRQGGGLARPGRPGDQHQAAGLLGQAGDHRGQAQLADGHRPLLDPAQHHPDRAALAEGVDPEPAHPGPGVGEVGLVGLVELLVQIGTDQVPEQLLGHVGGEVGPVQDDQPAVDPHARRRPDLQVQVRPLGGDQRLQPGHHARHRWLSLPGRVPHTGHPLIGRPLPGAA
jgi:hypothetical protein